MIVFLPQSDVYYAVREGINVVLLGGNPYAHAFTSIPSGLATSGGEVGFAYLPINVALAGPFQLIWDYRFGLVVSDIVTAVVIYATLKQGHRHANTAALVVMLLPTSVAMSTIFGNLTSFTSLFLALHIYAINRGQSMLGALALGFAFATSQIAFFLTPLLLFLPRKHFMITVSLAPLALTVIPYAIVQPGAMLDSLFQFHLEREPYRIVQSVGEVWSHNIGLTGIFMTVFGTAVPLLLRSILAVMSTVVCLWRIRTDRYLWGTILALTLIFLIPQNVFYSYYHVLMPLIVILVWRRFRLIQPEATADNNGTRRAREE
jgi:hypothetical protein